MHNDEVRCTPAIFPCRKTDDVGGNDAKTVRGPSRIFLIRHADRFDNEGGPAGAFWRRNSPRPHDTPLSAEGHYSAHRLGRYLALRRGVCKDGCCVSQDFDKAQGPASHHTVVIASPLRRAIETAHNIVCGLVAATEKQCFPVKGTKCCRCRVKALHSRIATFDPLPDLSSSLGSLRYTNGHGDCYEEAWQRADATFAKTTNVGCKRDRDECESDSNRCRMRCCSVFGVEDTRKTIIPIFAEAGAMESAKCQTKYDIQVAERTFGNVSVSLNMLEAENVPVEVHPPYGGGASHSPLFLRHFVSPFVELSPFACPLRESTHPATYKGGFSDVAFRIEPSPGSGDHNRCTRVVCNENEAAVARRCAETIRAIANSPALQETEGGACRTVIVVGHSQTVREMFAGLAGHQPAVRPDSYTMVAELARVDEKSAKGEDIYFYRAVPMRSATAGRQGSHSFELPHVEPF